MVDFLESRPCRFGAVHIGNKVDCIGDIVDCDKLSNSRFVAKTGHKVDCIGNKVDLIGDSRLSCRFVAGFGNSQVCRQCVLGFIADELYSEELWLTLLS